MPGLYQFSMLSNMLFKNKESIHKGKYSVLNISIFDTLFCSINRTEEEYEKLFNAING